MITFLSSKRKLNSRLKSGINYDVMSIHNSDPTIANVTFAIEVKAHIWCIDGNMNGAVLCYQHHVVNLILEIQSRA
jgi:hypothetical protein